MRQWKVCEWVPEALGGGVMRQAGDIDEGVWEVEVGRGVPVWILADRRRRGAGG